MDTPTKVDNDQPDFVSLKDKIARETLKAITVSPFKLTKMTSVQAAVLPLLPDLVRPYNPEEAEGKRKPRDLLVKARTGTGKTIAFLVPAIERRVRQLQSVGKQAVRDAGLESDKHLEARAIRAFSRKNVGTLIISPTRELATQIANEALRLTTHHNDMEVRLFVGGASKRAQMQEWMRGRRDIVVSTPGRILDFIQSEPEVANGLAGTSILILDEADTLLDMGFRDDIDAIVKALPPQPERQTFLFSATLDTRVSQVARTAMGKDFTLIDCVESDAPPTHAHIPQYHTVLPSAAHQIPFLLRLLAHDQLINAGKSKCIVFFPTTKMTQLFSTLVRKLSTVLPAGENTTVYEMHSQRDQRVRERTSSSFRADCKGASILVTSDVSARGVDYPGVTRVIQIGVPSNAHQYIHRVGRTGRGDEMTGRADLVLLPWEVGYVTWQLTDVPLKPLTTSELEKQVTTLAKQYDEDPFAFYETVNADSEKASRLRFPKEYSAVLGNMTTEIKNLLIKLDEEAVRETMASMLGYYASRSGDLRVQRNVILEGLKDWTVEACGLPVPPHVSDAFLTKVGMHDGRTKRFGKPREEYIPRGGMRSSPWEGRGSVKAKRERTNREYEPDSNSSNERAMPPWERRQAEYPRDKQQRFSRSDDNGFGDRKRSFGSRGRSGEPYRGYDSRD
ncbi:DEAD-domain-containing protein [Laetiporus sulphureus 93-53]|uniref:ATP-dependent RNA helicase n=1 Tax=Laetiporus sulphureus 93-53 TaxID=1314785 RepID=A0A165GES9_9APHY|nr:DEAD-domain-containing protein [Laetiporus sulphureus 93-53]KZT10251.1 DEAD-domain-containing protein [Laetiporus sulphureus 93-53]